MNPDWNDITALEEALAILPSDLSAVKVNNVNYPLADSEARLGVVDNRERIDALSAGEDYLSSQIDNLSDIVAGGVSYRGKAAEPLTDGSTKNPISVVDGEGTK